jgi:hypothetical protein
MYETEGRATGSAQNFGKPWKFGQMLGKSKKIRTDLSENTLNSGYFITISSAYKFGHTFNCPPESISPASLWVNIALYRGDGYHEILINQHVWQ